VSQDVVELFRAAMREHDLELRGELNADGKLHRFKPVGSKSSSEPGWYVLHADDPASGAFGNWKTGLSETWTAKRGSELTAAERAELKLRIERDRKAREEEAECMRARAREKAAHLWGKAHEPSSAHPYLKAKGIGVPPNIRQIRDMLLVPVRDTAAELHSLQVVHPDGRKTLLTGGRVRGCYSTMGRPGSTLVICEGMATGASILQATGHAVAIAFSAGNLEPVARALREKYPELQIIVAADNDRFTDGNPGVRYATEAALAVNGLVTVPAFSPDDSTSTDFNDLFLSRGAAAVCDAFLEARAPKLPPTHSAQEPGPQATVEPSTADPTSAPTVLPSPLPPTEVDYLTDLPHVRRSRQGDKPMGTIENVREICKRLGVIIRYNVISKEEEILVPGGSFLIDNRQNASLAWLTSQVVRFNVPTEKLGDYVTFLADQNPYNPVANWILSKPWDGRSRLPELYATVKAKGEQVRPEVLKSKEFLMRRWLLSAVAGVFRPNGVSAHGVLVFQGEQYVGKTHWFKRLVPAELGVIQDGVILRPDDKDSVKQTVSNWLVELGELDATFKRSDIAQLKAFITRDKDVLRRAYAKRESEFARRTVFFASVNPVEFLHDPTGNRRYWTIAVEHLNAEHDIDMQQLWAEVHAIYEFGDTWYLTAEEMAVLNLSNRQFEVRELVEERILAKFDFESPSILEHPLELSVSQILEKIGIERPTRHELNTCGEVVRRLSKGEPRLRHGMKLYRMPQPKVGGSDAR
jgi:putative DNA primase/helicase